MYDTRAIRECCDILVIAEQIGIQIKHENSSKPQIICPAHDDHNFGSAFLNTENKTFHCYACGAKGDVFDLVMATLNVSFKEAVRIVGDICGGAEHFMLGEEETQDFTQRKMFIPKESQKLIGIENEPIYVEVAYANTYAEVEKYDNNPEYSIRCERIQYGKDAYTVMKRAISNPLYDLLQDDEELYHEVIDNFCLNTLQNYLKFIRCIKNPALSPEEFKTPIEYLKQRVDLLVILTIICKMAKKVEKISITYGTGKSIQLVKNIEAEYNIIIATQQWQADVSAPF